MPRKRTSKKAYRRLARKYHPDVSKESNAEDRFKEVAEALRGAARLRKRAAYDQLGNNWRAGQEFRPPPGWQSGQATAGGGFGGGDFSDTESLFGGLGGLGGPGGARGFHGGGRGFQQPGGEDRPWRWRSVWKRFITVANAL